MDGATQVAYALQHYASLSLSAAVRFANKNEAQTYNHRALDYLEACRLVNVPNAHATPGGRLHSPCMGRGCGACQYTGRGPTTTPHRPEVCETCKLGHIAIDHGISLLNMPEHGPWEPGYVQPVLPHGVMREGIYKPGTLLQERLSERSTYPRQYIYIYGPASDGYTVTYQRGNIFDGRVHWDRQDSGTIPADANTMATWEVLDVWPPEFLRHMPVLAVNPLHTICPSLNNMF